MDVEADAEVVDVGVVDFRMVMNLFHICVFYFFQLLQGIKCEYSNDDIKDQMYYGY